MPLPFAKHAEPAVLKADQIGKGIVFAVVKDTADIGDLDPRERLRIRDASTNGSRPCSNAHEQRDKWAG